MTTEWESALKRWILPIVLVGLLIGAAACQRTPGEVMEKVRYDFGMGDRPEGYESVSDRVMESLRDVGEAEMRRMNSASRHGEVKFQEAGSLQGHFFKEVKVYESFYPLDAVPVSRAGSSGGRGYVGTISYDYRVYQSERFSTRTEAQAASADIMTDTQGRDVYRYNFGSRGVWDGRPGELTRR